MEILSDVLFTKLCRFIFSATTVLVLFLSFDVEASPVNTSIAAATGGSGTAAVEAGDSLILNPSTLVHLRGDHLYTSFGRDYTLVTLSENTEESIVPGGLAYISWREPGAKLQEIQDIRFVLADFVRNKISLGVSLHYFDLVKDVGRKNYLNADVGLSYTQNSNLGWGLAAYNVAGAPDQYEDVSYLQSSMAVGMNYIYRRFMRTRFDIQSAKNFDFSKPKYMFGFESYAGQFVVIRLGYQVDTLAQENLATAGLGFRGPKFQLNYGYQANAKDSTKDRHSIDLGVPF